MKPQKFAEFVSQFNPSQHTMPILLIEQVASSESQEKVFKTVPSPRAPMALVTQGRKAGSKPLDNAMAIAFQQFEKAARTGISLGRVETNKICLPDNAISKMHASFKLNRDERWEIVDVDSANSTRLNGKQIPSNSSTVLKEGDGITFADTFHCTFFTPAGFKAYVDSLK